MSLSLEEIRARAERFEVLRREEWYRIGAGLKSRPALEDLFRRHEELGDPDLFADVERALAGAPREEVERHRLLLAWLADFRVSRALSPLLDEFFAWEAGTTLDAAGRRLFFRQVPREICRTEGREERRRLATARDRVLEEAAPLWLDLVEREREAVRGLGYGAYLDARDRLSGVHHAGVLAEARRVVDETDDLFASRLDAIRESRGLSAGDAHQSDEWYLRRMPGLEGAFETADVRQLLARDLRAAGVLPDAAGRLTMELASRPLKRPGAFCAALRVPERVVGVVEVSGGWIDATRVLGVIGACLSRAYVEPRLGFEHRMLGERSVGEAQAALFRRLLTEPWWVRRLRGLDPVDVGGTVALAAWFDLQDFRRDVARLAFQVEMWQGRDLGDVVGGYADRLEEATGFRPAPQAFVEALEDGLVPSSRLRGRMLAASLRARLGSDYGADWLRNPAVGPFLTGLWTKGWRTGRRMARALGRDRVRGGDLVRWYRRRLGEGGSGAFVPPSLREPEP